MATAGPDLYESLRIRYPPSSARVLAPVSPPATSRWTLGTILALGVIVVLMLGSTLAAILTLYVQGQNELRAARAELMEVGADLLPDLDGARTFNESPAAVRKRIEQLGWWLQGLSLGWRYYQGKIYFFSGERKSWDEAEASCRSTHSHLASITSREEQDYLAQEARGGSYWIGLVATASRHSWRWVDGAAYSEAKSFWGPRQPDNTDHGKWGQESCVQIYSIGPGFWNDHNCNFTFHWICKRDLNQA